MSRVTGLVTTPNTVPAGVVMFCPSVNEVLGSPSPFATGMAFNRSLVSDTG